MNTRPLVTFIVIGQQQVFQQSATARPDPRVQLVSASSHTAAELNDAVSLALGEYVVFVNSSDRLVAEVLDAIEGLNAATSADMFYTDEVGVLKPAFSPERLRNQFYIDGLVGYRTDLLSNIGGVRAGVEDVELYDLALRASRTAKNVAHIAEAGIEVDRRSPPTAPAATLRVLQEHLEATGGGTVLAISPSVHDTRRAVVGSPLVSIVIPTRGDSAVVRGLERSLVVEAVRGVIDSSEYDNYEFVIVVDDSTPAPVIEELREVAGARLRLVPWSAPFSFSGKMNLGIVHARGEFVMFLNDDVEVISPDFLTPMLALAQLPGAGIVGCMLYFEDETIQHAGHAYYRSDVTHIGLNSARGARGPLDGFTVEREVDGVTAACAMIRKSVFFEAGGFSTLLPGNFNDVDLCMKVAALGYQSYFTPHSELYHFESKTRDPRVAAYEIETTWGRWENGFWESKFWPDDPHIVYSQN